jgi:dTDP-4-amino-4,6-dideoxygalactose transaminase
MTQVVTIPLPALLGGKAVRTGEWPPWPPPLPSAAADVEAVIRGRVWVRQSGRYTIEFEKALAAMLGVRQALTVCSGTGALHCVMRAMEIGPGDEVLVTPFTFHTGASIPLLNYALPIFVDIDPASLQMDPAAIADRAGRQTRAIIACHWGGQAADLDGIVAAGRKHGLQICEDAYQTLVGTWRGKALGTIGDIGLVGHHENEILPCGEGATLISHNEELIGRCYSAHDFGREWDAATHRIARGPMNHTGRNMKVMDVHGAILLAGLKVVPERARVRRDNAGFLKQRMAQIPGVAPQKEYAAQDRGGYSQAIFHYDRTHFAELPLGDFIRAVRAEGIPLSGTLGRPVSREDYIEATLSSPRFRKLYAKQRLDRVRDSLHCPHAERACETTFALHGRYLQASKDDMALVADAVAKVQKHAERLRKRGVA